MIVIKRPSPHPLSHRTASQSPAAILVGVVIVENQPDKERDIPMNWTLSRKFVVVEDIRVYIEGATSKVFVTVIHV